MVKKIVFILLDALILAYLVFVMLSFSKPLKLKDKICSEVSIKIADNVKYGFLTSAEIKNILVAKGLYPLKHKMYDINTREIEDYLQNNPLVEQAECYQTSDGKIFLDITQRMPVIRVKSVNGEDYYLDDKGEIISNVGYTTNLIVASGYISKTYAQKYLTNMGRFFIDSPIWKDEIEQLNVLKDGTMEMIPKTGNHVVYIGAPTDIETKMDRLHRFYVDGLDKIGWNKYSYINIEFNNQIICKKKKS